MQIGKRLRGEWVELGERSDDHSRKHHESPKQSISSPAATTKSMNIGFKGSSKNHTTSSIKINKRNNNLTLWFPGTIQGATNTRG